MICHARSCHARSCHAGTLHLVAMPAVVKPEVTMPVVYDALGGKPFRQLADLAKPIPLVIIPVVSIPLVTMPVVTLPVSSMPVVTGAPSASPFPVICTLCHTYCRGYTHLNSPRGGVVEI